MNLKKPSIGFLYSLSQAFLWACSLVIARYLLKNGENPLNLTVWVNMFVFLPWLFLFRKHAVEFKRLSTKHILLLIVIGVSGSIGINYLQSLALQNTTAVNFAFLYRTIVVFTIVFAWIFFKEKITTKKLVLATLILVGSYLLTTNGQRIVFTLGDVYTLLMAASAAFIANILTKHTVSKMHPDLSGSVTSMIGTVTLLSFALLTGVLQIPKEILLIVMSAALLLLQIMARNRAYRVASASFVTMMISLTPLFVTVLSFFVLHESLEPVEIIGGLIIVGSVFLVEKFKI